MCYGDRGEYGDVDEQMAVIAIPALIKMRMTIAGGSDHGGVDGHRDVDVEGDGQDLHADREGGRNDGAHNGCFDNEDKKMLLLMLQKWWR